MVGWLKRGKTTQENNVKLNQGASESSMFIDPLKQRTTFIKKMSLTNIKDIQVIQGEISEGNMTIIDVAGFITSGDYSMLEMKRAIEQIRGTCKQLGGALARLGNRYLVATPNNKMQLVV
mgnify:CR=1 FL=1